ncbi:MAG TPA: FkbM family methyltransferase [Ignavibacteriales bacterium]|nr:FkbM family methyltransferase [Ignavibacteriales bacterium]
MRVFLEHTQYWLYRFLTNKNYRRFIWYSIFYGSKKRFETNNFKFNGIKIFVPDTLSFLWQYKEIFVDEDYKFHTNSQNPVIYDCGANIGMSCFYFSAKYPTAKIKAFEADPDIKKILSENLKKNNVGNVEVIGKAVWIDNNFIELSLEGADGATIYSKTNLVKIPSIRLRDMINKELRIDMLKIDIEGAEYEVLLDCSDSLSKVDNIFVEYHSYINSNQNLSEIIRILEKNSFRYFIKPVNDRKTPLINRKNKFNPGMDLQLNIYGYKIN